MPEAITLTFDTYRFIKRLTEAGFTESQAEALVEEQVNFLNSNVATKHDIANAKTDTTDLKTEIKADIADLRAELKTDIAALRTALKTDMAALRTALKTDMAAFRTALKTDIANIKADLLKWMVGALIALSGILIGYLTLVLNNI